LKGKGREGGKMTGTEIAILSTETTTRASTELAKMTPWMARIEEHPRWETVSQLEVTMSVGVELNQFKVRDLLTLKAGQVFESIAAETDDVPLKVGQVQLGWSEFEVVEQRLGLRLTRLG
jgi:hypothetical protein